jgi:hypothetical protein
MPINDWSVKFVTIRIALLQLQKRHCSIYSISKYREYCTRTDAYKWSIVKICNDLHCFDYISVFQMISLLLSLNISYPSTTNSTCCCHLVSQTLDCTSTELDHHDSVVPVVATVILLLSSSTSKYWRSLRQYRYVLILQLTEMLQYVLQLHCNSSICFGRPSNVNQGTVKLYH